MTKQDEPLQWTRSTTPASQTSPASPTSPISQTKQIKQTTNQATNQTSTQPSKQQPSAVIGFSVLRHLQVVSVSPQRIFMRKLISKLELSDPEAMNSSARTPTAPVGKHHPFWTNMRLTNKSAGGGAGEMGIPANFGGFASPTQWEFKSTRWKNYSTHCVTFWTTISRPLITSKHDGSARALFTVLHSCYTAILYFGFGNTMQYSVGSNCCPRKTCWKSK